jgi:hypothetical protein
LAAGALHLPWITQSFAEFLHFQLFTIVLAGFAAWALRLAYKDRETLRAAGLRFWRLNKCFSSYRNPLYV